MPLRKIAVAAGLLVLAALSARQASAQSYSFQTLDDPNGVKGTAATGINDLGQIVGTYTDAGSVQHGFTYNGGLSATSPSAAPARHSSVTALTTPATSSAVIRETMDSSTAAAC